MNKLIILISECSSEQMASYSCTEGCVVYSFRHSMRDRLRAFECPKETIDQIGGWSSSDVGETYGEGFPLDNVSVWMTKML